MTIPGEGFSPGPVNQGNTIPGGEVRRDSPEQLFLLLLNKEVLSAGVAASRVDNLSRDIHRALNVGPESEKLLTGVYDSTKATTWGLLEGSDLSGVWDAIRTGTESPANTLDHNEAVCIGVYHAVSGYAAEKGDPFVWKHLLANGLSERTSNGPTGHVVAQLVERSFAHGEEPLTDPHEPNNKLFAVGGDLYSAPEGAVSIWFDNGKQGWKFISSEGVTRLVEDRGALKDRVRGLVGYAKDRLVDNPDGLQPIIEHGNSMLERPL